MTQYLLLKTDGESEDQSFGLTSDQSSSGGVLGADTYKASEVSFSGYLELNSSTSDYVAIDSKLQSSTISGLTVMAWVRSTDTSSESIISSHDRSEYYRFNLASGNFDCSFDTSGGGGDFNSGVFVSDGRWHHLAAVYDAGEVRMYVDGRRVLTNTGNGTEIGSGGSRYGFLGTGSEAESFDGSTGPSNYGNLNISDHRLYLDAKTDAEIKQTFEGSPPTTNLHEHLPLTANDSGRLIDKSGNSRDGFLRNESQVVSDKTGGLFEDQNTFVSASSGPVVFENVEDGDLSDWTVNEGTLSVDSGRSIGANSMFHSGMSGVSRGETNDPRGAIKKLDSPRRVKSFSFMYWETSSNTSAAISLYNSNGARELSFGSDNPSWYVNDADGDTSFGSPGEYRDWIRFTITFDWDQSQYTIVGTDIQTGYSRSYTGNLIAGVDIAEVASGQVGIGGYTGDGEWYLDQMQFNITETAIATGSAYDTVGSSVFSETTFNALQEIASSNTIGNSSSDTTAGGFTQFYTQSGEVASMSGTSSSQAATQSFVGDNITSVPTALSDATASLSDLTVQTLQSGGNAIVNVAVAAELASAVVQDADASFSDVFSNALKSSSSYGPVVANGDGVTTLLGQATLANATPEGGSALVEISAFVSPQSSDATPAISTVDSAVSASGSPTEVFTVELTPTTSIIVQVRSGQLNLEDSFADSLSASVGAETEITVAKTIADAVTNDSTEQTQITSAAVAQLLAAITQQGDLTTETQAGSLRQLLESTTLGNSTSESVFGADTTNVSAVSEQSSSEATGEPVGEVVGSIFSEIDSTEETSATADIIAETAQSLSNAGVVESDVSGVALVTSLLGDVDQADLTTSTDVSSLLADTTLSHQTAQPFSETESQSADSVTSFNADEKSSDPDTLANIGANVSEAIINSVDSSGEAASTANGIANTAQSLSNAGVVETDVAGVALVTSLLADVGQADVESATTTESSLQSANFLRQTSELSTEARSESVDSVSKLAADGDVSAASTVTNTNAATVKSALESVTSDGDSSAISNAEVETFSATFLQALLFILRVEQLDENFIRNITNDVEILNKENKAIVVNND